MIDTRTETVYLKSYVKIDPELTQAQDPPVIPDKVTKDVVEEWMAEAVRTISDLNIKLKKISLIENQVIEKQVKVEDL